MDVLPPAPATRKKTVALVIPKLEKTQMTRININPLTNNSELWPNPFDLETIEVPEDQPPQGDGAATQEQVQSTSASPDGEGDLRKLVSLLEKSTINTGAHEELTTFSGDYREWDFFYEQFLAVVDENPKLDTIIKLKKLIGALRGPALSAVRAYRFCARNYGPIKTALKERFGSRQKIFTDMFRKISDYTQVRLTRPSDFRQFVDLCTEMLHHLVAQSDQNLYDPLPYVTVILSKLPPDCLDGWQREQQCYDRTYMSPMKPERLLHHLIEYLNHYVERLFNTQHYNPTLRRHPEEFSTTDYSTRTQGTRARRPAKKTAAQKDKKGSSSQGRKIQTVNTITTVADVNYQIQKKQQKKNEGKGKDPKTCCFCKGNHPPRYCRANWPHPDQALKLISQARLCLSCLKENHQLKNCQETKICGRDGCQQKHHPSLHGHKTPNRESRRRD